MRRHWESMNNDKKKSVAIGRALLSGPYLIWMIGFTIIPLALIFWFGITTKNGNLTLANITAIMSPDHWKALWLSLGLSLISTVLCLVLAYPLAIVRSRKFIHIGRMKINTIKPLAELPLPRRIMARG